MYTHTTYIFTPITSLASILSYIATYISKERYVKITRNHVTRFSKHSTNNATANVDPR